MGCPWPVFGSSWASLGPVLGLSGPVLERLGLTFWLVVVVAAALAVVVVKGTQEK